MQGENQINEKDEIKDEDTAADTSTNRLTMADLSTIFPSNKIKSQLYRNEQVPRIDSAGIKLISTTSAVFLQDFLKQIPTSNHDGDNDDKNPNDHKIVTLSAIRQTIESNPKYSFLKASVEGLHEPSNTVKIYKSPSKKSKKQSTTTTTTTTSQVAKKIKTTNTNDPFFQVEPNATVDRALLSEATLTSSAAATSQPIVEDDDDYDWNPPKN